MSLSNSGSQLPSALLVPVFLPYQRHLVLWCPPHGLGSVALVWSVLPHAFAWLSCSVLALLEGVLCISLTPQYVMSFPYKAMALNEPRSLNPASFFGPYIPFSLGSMQLAVCSLYLPYVMVTLLRQ